MRRNYSQPSGSASYQRRYAGFRGVDFTSSPLYVDPTRSPYAENIIVDAAGVVHKRPGYKTIYDVHDESVEVGASNGLFVFEPKTLPNTNLVLHNGNEVYRIDTVTTIPEFLAEAADAPSSGFQFKDRFYLLDGKDYRVMYWDDATNEMLVREVYEVATPTETQIAGYYLAEEKTTIDSEQQQQTTIEYTWQFGEKGERNLLTGRRINTFCGDGIHTTFYFDCANFKVYKVELYRLIPDQGGSSTEETVTIEAHSNIRKKPSMSGEIITNTGSNTPTCITTGKSGSWYQILWENQTAYVHQQRVSSHASGATAITTDDKGWETLTSGYTVSEDSSKHCTKIVFDTHPPAHPRGNGLPNIRVTGAMTEIATSAPHIVTAAQAEYGSVTIRLYPHEMATGVVSVSKNGTAISSSAYSVDDRGEHDIRVTVSSGLSEGDELMVTYRRETFRDIDTIGKCNVYGRYGEYNHDRFFFTGNPDHLNRDWYTEPSDPTIVLENSYTDIGDQHTGIAGYLNFQSDMLIIKYDSNGDNLFRRTADTDGDLTIFPVKAYKGRGVTSAKAIANIKGDCVFLTPEGVYEFVSSDLGSKYGTKEMSYTVRRMLLKENLAEGVMGVWGDLLILSFPTTRHCYVADTSQLTAPSSSGGNGWEWFYWTGIRAENFITERSDVYFTSNVNHSEMIMTFKGESDTPRYADDYGMYVSDYISSPITALWTTPLDEMDEPARYKYLSRRGAMLQFDQAVSQMLEVAVIMDGETMLLYRDEDMLRDYLNHSDYTFVDLKAATGIPYFTLNTPSGRFKYLQFILRNSDPNTDGIALMCLEFQYRFGRYII